jgi:hypothetical protein
MTDLHSNSLHFTPLHYNCRHFTSSHLNFTHLHFTTLHYPVIWFNAILCTFYSLCFIPLITAFLNLFLKLLGLQRKVPIACVYTYTCLYRTKSTCVEEDTKIPETTSFMLKILPVWKAHIHEGTALVPEIKR